MSFDKMKKILENKYKKLLEQEVDTVTLQEQDSAQQEQDKLRLDEEVLQQNFQDLQEIKLDTQDKQGLLTNIVKISRLLSSKMDHHNKYINALIADILL